MISFTKDGKCEVWFEIVGARSSQRPELRFSLDEFLALAKTTRTEEELRLALFEYDRKKYKALGKVVGG
jgi:hypothetical protein